ncbi:MAG TPA: PEP/pyruvate-binding domain-containing protein [Acidobacteriota bacterium]|nr:PEP/pyruvate-binding domain-containing protein [Acidobacteriota bacterium]
MKDFLLFMEKIGRDDVTKAGLIARDAALLYAAGIPVPETFVVSADAYSKRMNELGLEERLRALWNSRNAVADVAEFAAKASSEILERGLDDILRADISKAAASLGAQMIDVTLSPIVASYDAAAIAGLAWSASFLPPEAAADAAAECWAAMWGERQVTFRMRAGIEPGSDALWGAAVIVSAAKATPMRGVVVPADTQDADSWVIRVEPRLPSEREIAVQKEKTDKTGSPLTSAQAEALTILADGAAEALGEPRALRWVFDGSRFLITGSITHHLL